RGGAHDDVRLMDKGSARALGEFEFSLEGKGCCITRTVQRTKQGTVRTSQQITLQNGAGQWEPVEGASLQKGFKEWIEQHVGLTYETFTSSVLLLQGRAERLLDSSPKGRFEVLAGIVDLERYERLHRRADEERKALDGRVKSAQGRLAALPEGSSGALLEAEGHTDAADT